MPWDYDAKYEVIVHSWRDQTKIETITAIRENTRLTLAETIDLFRTKVMPVTVLTGATEHKARTFKTRLQELGIRVSTRKAGSQFPIKSFLGVKSKPQTEISIVFFHSITCDVETKLKGIDHANCGCPCHF